MSRHPSSVTLTLRQLQQAGLSLRTLAQVAGRSPSLIEKIAKNERRMTREVAEALASALDRLANRCSKAAQVVRAAGHQREKEEDR
jgi:plasmid maintenance system antidote protein VapI